jgi:hypothetical protein
MVFPAAGSLELLRKSMMGFGASDVCGLVMSDFQRSGPISMIVH